MRTCSCPPSNGESTSIHAVSSGSPSSSRWKRSGCSVAEKSVTLRAAAKRGFRCGAGRTLRRHSTAPRGERVRSNSECAPNDSARRSRCSASNQNACSGGSGCAGCSAKCSPIAAAACWSASSSGCGGASSTWYCVSEISRSSAFHCRVTRPSARFNGGSAARFSARAAAPSIDALYIARARGTRLCASSTSTPTRQSCAAARPCSSALASKKWLWSPTTTSLQRASSWVR